jgi:hypothetical protein
MKMMNYSNGNGITCIYKAKATDLENFNFVLLMRPRFLSFVLWVSTQKFPFENQILRPLEISAKMDTGKKGKSWIFQGLQYM